MTAGLWSSLGLSDPKALGLGHSDGAPPCSTGTCCSCLEPSSYVPLSVCPRLPSRSSWQLALACLAHVGGAFPWFQDGGILRGGSQDMLGHHPGPQMAS